MKRRHFFEFEDLRWFPAVLRDAVTDFLRDELVLGLDVYAPTAALVNELMSRQGDWRVLDLCSGGSGPWRKLKPKIDELARDKGPVEITLTDLYPNLDAYEHARKEMGEHVHGRTEPVDARNVPADLPGVRTIFTGLHHLTPDDVHAIFADAARREVAIGAFEFTERTWPSVLKTVPLGLALSLISGLRKPWKPPRLLFTYLIPLIPIAIVWDGVVSNLRTYRTDELERLTAGLSSDRYAWRVGVLRPDGGGPPITYALGYPITTSVGDAR